MVSAGKHDRVDTLVTMDIPPALKNVREWTVAENADGPVIAAQRWLDEAKPKLSWIIAGRLNAGAVKRFIVSPEGSNGAEGALAQCVDDGRHLILKIDHRPVLQYNHAVVESPAGIESIYRRSGHIHPLYTPSGREVTGDFPPDHAHQHGVFFPWVRTTFRGKPVDFWNQKGGTAKIEHAEIVGKTGGAVFAQFTVTKIHSAKTAPDQYEPVLKERWTVRAYNVSGLNVIDLESRQVNISDVPLKIAKFHYGGLAIRGSHDWYDAGLESRINKLMKGKASADELGKVVPLRDYLTSEGKTWLNGNATPARWVEMHGEIGGKPAGVMVLGHPDNFRAPQTVRLHPGKPYFCFAPMATGDFEILPGKVYASKFRFITHDGVVNAKLNELLWRDYAEPPTVKVKPLKP